MISPAILGMDQQEFQCCCGFHHRIRSIELSENCLADGFTFIQVEPAAGPDT